MQRGDGLSVGLEHDLGANVILGVLTDTGQVDSYKGIWSVSVSDQCRVHLTNWDTCSLQDV